MIRVLAMTVMLAACAPAPQTAPTPPQPQPGPTGMAEPLVENPMPQLPQDGAPATECDVTVSYGSFASGVDHQLQGRIGALLENNADVTETSSSRWGMEGESTLCVRTTNVAAANRLYSAIADMLPAVSPRAPTTVTHRDGRSHSAGGGGVGRRR